MTAPSGLWAWAQERFAPAQTVAFALMLVTAVAFGQASVDAAVGWPSLGLLHWSALTGFFLLLRIIDEHKDSDEDRELHPQRVLSRGGVSLRQLRGLGLVAFGVQLAAASEAPRAALLAWVGTFAWAWLMAVEFGVGAWLKKHPVAYGTSHMLVIVGVALWLYALGASTISLAAWPLIALMFGAGMAQELARKARGHEESPLLESYRVAAGTPGLCFGLTTVWGLCVLGQWVMLQGQHAPAGAYAAVVLGALVVGLAIFRLAARPDATSRKFAENCVLLASVAAYVTPLWAMIEANGWTWN